MEAELALDIVRESLVVVLKIVSPLLIVALIVGSSVSLVQALTQIQEPTLTFMPKLLALAATLLVLMSYIGHVMSIFFERISSLIINLN